MKDLTTKKMTVELTGNEYLLNKLIHKIESSNSEFSAQRDKEILFALQMVVTLSIDDQLKELVRLMSEKFPEYGGG
jgi:hypothetical protein